MPEDLPGAASHIGLGANPSLVSAVFPWTLAWIDLMQGHGTSYQHGRNEDLSKSGCASRNGSATPSASSALNALGHKPIALPSRLGPFSRSMTLTGMPTCSA